jgi:carbonic anhydrase/acetyltransferase-like protein (isoleucine patch superfamily)
MLCHLLSLSLPVYGMNDTTTVDCMGGMAMLYRFDGKQPVIGSESYVSETATVIGDVKIGERCYIGHGAILRGDYGAIVLGNETSVEEGVIVHAPPQETCTIGNGVVIGHGATVHSKSIGDRAGVGMGAVLSIRSEIGDDSVVGEGAVVKQGQIVPPGVVVGGNPAKKIKDMTDKDIAFWVRARQIYVDLALKYLKIGMERVG